MSTWPIPSDRSRWDPNRALGQNRGGKRVTTLTRPETRAAKAPALSTRSAMLDPDSIAANAAHDFAQALAPRWSAQLGSNLLGVYLLGSLAHGGFSRRYSD